MASVFLLIAGIPTITELEGKLFKTTLLAFLYFIFGGESSYPIIKRIQNSDMIIVFILQSFFLIGSYKFYYKFYPKFKKQRIANFKKPNQNLLGVLLIILSIINFLVFYSNSVGAGSSDQEISGGIFGFISAYYGKLKVIPELMNLRSLENKPINNINWDQGFRFPKWIIDSNQIKSHMDFFKNLNSSAFKFLKHPNNFSIAISTGFMLYALKQPKKKLNLYSKAVNIINILLPASIVNFLKKSFRKLANVFFKEKNISQLLIKKCKELENGNVKIDNNSINRIIFEITKFYN